MPSRIVLLISAVLAAGMSNSCGISAAARVPRSFLNYYSVPLYRHATHFVTLRQIRMQCSRRWRPAPYKSGLSEHKESCDEISWTTIPGVDAGV